jgi:hypothetical protein
MAEADVPDDLKPWLGRCQDRIREMLVTDNRTDPQQRYKELLEMAMQFLSLSKKFVDIADTAYKAAQGMGPIEDVNRETSVSPSE